MPYPESTSIPNAASSFQSDITNGATRSASNGSVSHALPNGVSNNASDDGSSLEDSMRAQKQKAKAQLSASDPPAEQQDAIETSHTANGTSITPTTNGTIQTRKRSRSGTRIIRPLDTNGLQRRRGTNDPDGTQIDKIKVIEYVERDHIHLMAHRQDQQQHAELHDRKVKEKSFHMEMRGQRPQRPAETAEELARKVRVAPKLEDHNLFIRSPEAVEKIWGHGYGQYGYHGNSVGQRTPEVLLPAHRPRAGARQARHVKIPRRALDKHAEQLDDLVPIRLDIEWEHVELGKIRLRDTFTWNLHDRLTDLRIFAENLVEDFGLPLRSCEALVAQVVHSMQEQIQDYYPHVFIDTGSADPTLPYWAYKDDELRITIKLNITIGQHTLVDQFEWDMNNSTDAAELFARQMAQDLALSGEFTTAIAHSIREQTQLFTRSLYVVGYHFDGALVADEDIRAGLSPSPMPSAVRPYQAAKEFTPYFYELNDAELEKTELSLSREERRQKRSVHRRGGPVLPDLKDRQRTIRTLVISSVIPGAAETLEDCRIFKRLPAASGRGKRSGYAKDGDDDSDDLLESDDSSPEEVIPAGTARTRGMRGMATQPHANMKGVIGRSATPETAILHHHETRTSGRRFGGKDYREESVDDTQASLVVKLSIPRDRFRRFLQDMTRNRNRPAPLDAPAHSTRRSTSATPGLSTPVPGSMRPPSTPGQTPAQPHLQQASPGQSRDSQPTNPLHTQVAQLGRVDANGPPAAGNPAPPPPSWLTQSLAQLQTSYPSDKFEGTMRYTAVSLETDLPVSTTVRPGETPPDDIKFMYYPRIKCLDCPGKLYTPGPETGVNNFEVHLRNKVHRERVEARVAKKERREQ